MKTVVVNIRKEPFDAYIGRAGRGEDGYLGNPFPIGPGMTREQSLERFQRYFDERIKKDSEFRKRVEGLRGMRIGCFCKPLECHGDVYVYWLDKMETEESSRKGKRKWQ